MKTIRRRDTPKTLPTPDSPEVTGNYRCPCCGNTEQFIGHDDHGYPGDACECGKVVCECQATLRQHFRVDASGEVTYEAFTGGGNGAEIGAYDRIQCARCGVQIWPAKPKAPLHPDLDVANPQGSSPTELGDTDNRPAGEFRIKTRRRNSQPQSGGTTT
jgi:hypothetical protein